MPSAIPIHVAWSAAEWAAAVAALPAEGPLPVRTVLVPNGRVAHSLRRELLRAGRGDALAGTLFRPLHVAAADVVQAAGARFSPGEEALRATRLAGLFREELPLEYFDLELMRTARGWEDAFARTIADLEGTGLRPDDLLAPDRDDPRWRDVATVWRRADELAGSSWTTARIVAEAAARLEREPGLWPHEGAVLAPVASDLTPAVARFVRALPRVELVLLPARPLRRRYLERIELLLGADVRRALEGARAQRRAGSEKEILESYLFEPGDVLGDPSRPRSTGPDGTVRLEEHAGVEEEVEAAARWVAREVLERGTPLEDLAVLVPARDHVADLVAARIERLPWKDGEPFPVLVAGGRPLVSYAGGARALCVVGALRRHLAVESLVSVLPALKLARRDDGAPKHLTHDEAMALAWGLGTVGGNPAHPRGALDWTSRLTARRAALERLLAEAPGDGLDPDDGDEYRRRDLWQEERTLAAIEGVAPAVSALVEVARTVVDGEPLAAVWKGLRDFLDEHASLDVGRWDVLQRLDEAMGPLCADARCAAVTGEDAVKLIEEALLGVRVAGGRFGHPAVYVGTIDSALGLRFAAVRVLGLLEGALPGQPHEDAVLPDALRAAMPTFGRVEDRAISQLHALDRVVRDADRVVLSTPHLDAQRVEREPSSLFIEAAAALGRPNAVTGEPLQAPVPDTKALRRDAFDPARRDDVAFRIASPVTATDWQDVVARRETRLPSAWSAGGALDLGRIRALRAPDAPPGPLDGLLGAAPVVMALLPGLSVDRPTSASRLKTLLECPHRFLLETVLRFRNPQGPAEAGRLDNLTYGSLFHAIAEELYARAGAEICSRGRDPEHWHAVAHEIAERKLDEILEAYPLAGEHVRGQERARLRRDVACFLDYDARTARTFVRTEMPFGYPTAHRLDVEGGVLFVRGFVDRVDVQDGCTLVRDLKTGNAHPRTGKEADPSHRRDLQLGLYGIVLRELATTLGLPGEVRAAYVHTDPHEPERAFREDFDALEAEARSWLSVAHALLSHAAFPRTTMAEEDCRYCPFTPVCGPDPKPRAVAVLEASAEVTGPFRRVKDGAGESAGGDDA